MSTSKKRVQVKEVQISQKQLLKENKELRLKLYRSNQKLVAAGVLVEFAKHDSTAEHFYTRGRDGIPVYNCKCGYSEALKNYNEAMLT